MEERWSPLQRRLMGDRQVLYKSKHLYSPCKIHCLIFEIYRIKYISFSKTLIIILHTQNKFHESQTYKQIQKGGVSQDSISLWSKLLGLAEGTLNRLNIGKVSIHCATGLSKHRVTLWSGDTKAKNSLGQDHWTIQQWESLNKYRSSTTGTQLTLEFASCKFTITNVGLL